MKQSASNMETKLRRIEELSSKDHRLTFNWLIQHVNKDNLIRCFRELDGKKALGVDGISKDEYAVNLDENINSLLERMKSLKYYPAPVRGVNIPKGNGKYRPLGISTIEDKIVQSMFAKILNAIYEPIFVNESFGFRRGRSCHDAIKSLHKHLSSTNECVALDIDLSNFFGTIDHRKLIQLLELKIKDQVFIRYIVRMLKAGVLADGELTKSDTGSPQGSIVSPVLSNIFAHYCIDLWVKHMVSKHVTKPVHIVRYADDVVICVCKEDAPKVLKALEGRLKRFSLELNQEKTKVVSFSKSEATRGIKQQVINFLGFTIYLGKSKTGYILVKIKTASKAFTSKLKAFNQWCRENRSKMKLAEFWEMVRAKLRGHFQYYGVSHNFRKLDEFLYRSVTIAFKWLNRRSQRKSFTWDKFNLYLEMFPLPKPKISVRLF